LLHPLARHAWLGFISLRRTGRTTRLAHARCTATTHAGVRVSRLGGGPAPCDGNETHRIAPFALRELEVVQSLDRISSLRPCVTTRDLRDANAERNGLFLVEDIAVCTRKCAPFVVAITFSTDVSRILRRFADSPAASEVHAWSGHTQFAGEAHRVRARSSSM
jgi:hypothetical protein